MIWLTAIAALFIGILLVLSGRRLRRQRGLGQGRTLDLDGRNLYSVKYGLSGRPDRIIEGGVPGCTTRFAWPSRMGYAALQN
jgi:hypothetical protein